VAVFRPLQRKLTIMGHHAQYKKRGSSHTGDPAPVYPLAAPEPGDWNLQPVGETIEVKILVTHRPRNRSAHSIRGAPSWLDDRSRSDPQHPMAGNSRIIG